MKYSEDEQSKQQREHNKTVDDQLRAEQQEANKNRAPQSMPKGSPSPKPKGSHKNKSNKQSSTRRNSFLFGSGPSKSNQ